MFDLSNEVQRLKQLEHDIIHGLPYKPKPKNPFVKHIDDVIFEQQAEIEGMALSRSYRSHTIDFGIRLSKAKGEKHRVGGVA